MNEAEAKEKWCPFARVQFIAQGAANRLDPTYLTFKEGPDKAYMERQVQNTKCLGSGCMAWRTIQTPYAQGQEPPEKIGYCGLAGKP